MPLKYKRVLLKLSGEVFQGVEKHGIDFNLLDDLARQIKEVQKAGAQVAIVIGGGNFWRYRDFVHSHLERVNSDYMGMMATVINSIAFASSLKHAKVKVKVLSALRLPIVVKDYTVRSAKKLLDDGYVIICAGGTGNPFFTTDTAASLRAAELECNLLMKATNVDYVYDKDPKKSKNAKKFDQISYLEVLKRRLKVMDLSAIALCSDSNIPVKVFNLQTKGNIKKIINGQKIGTLIHNS